MRTAINAAIIGKNGLLLVKKRDIWILPGGKLQRDESELGCLCREVSEELSGTRIEIQQVPFGIFTGRTPHKQDLIEVVVYFANLASPLGKHSKEIRAREFTLYPENYNLSEITSQIVGRLRGEGYL